MSNLDRKETKRYLEMFYILLMRDLVSKVRPAGCWGRGWAGHRAAGPRGPGAQARASAWQWGQGRRGQAGVRLIFEATCKGTGFANVVRRKFVAHVGIGSCCWWLGGWLDLIDWWWSGTVHQCTMVRVLWQAAVQLTRRAECSGCGPRWGPAQRSGS